LAWVSRLSRPCRGLASLFISFSGFRVFMVPCPERHAPFWQRAVPRPPCERFASVFCSRADAVIMTDLSWNLEEARQGDRCHGELNDCRP
jgi:hypothetical protein